MKKHMKRIEEIEQTQPNLTYSLILICFFFYVLFYPVTETYMYFTLCTFIVPSKLENRQTVECVNDGTGSVYSKFSSLHLTLTFF